MVFNLMRLDNSWLDNYLRKESDMGYLIAGLIGYFVGYSGYIHKSIDTFKRGFKEGMK